MGIQIGYGSTAGIPWSGEAGIGVYQDIDTSHFGFPVTPLYLTALYGRDSHWDTVGVTSIYEAGRYGFRVYVRRRDGSPLTPEDAEFAGWYVKWSATYASSIRDDRRETIIWSGESGFADGTAWQQYKGEGGPGIFINVDAREARFPTAPRYVCSLTGVTRHWATTGGSSIYNASKDGFRVYVRMADGGPISPADALAYHWSISWIGQHSDIEIIN
jgi:hypothetical protein